MHSKLYPRAKSHQMGFTMSNAIWCLILKWRISKKGMPSGGRSYDPYTGHYYYFSEVTRESVCIALTMVALHDQEVKEADSLNAYVMAPNHERIWTVLGP